MTIPGVADASQFVADANHPAPETLNTSTEEKCAGSRGKALPLSQ